MRNALKSALVLAFAMAMTGPAFAPSARAQVAVDPPRDLFYECTPEFDGFVIRYAVGDRPNQIVYVYLCDGSTWTLIDVET